MRAPRVEWCRTPRPTTGRAARGGSSRPGTPVPLPLRTPPSRRFSPAGPRNGRFRSRPDSTPPGRSGPDAASWSVWAGPARREFVRTVNAWGPFAAGAHPPHHAGRTRHHGSNHTGARTDSTHARCSRPGRPAHARAMGTAAGPWGRRHAGRSRYELPRRGLTFFRRPPTRSSCSRSNTTTRTAHGTAGEQWYTSSSVTPATVAWCTRDTHGEPHACRPPPQPPPPPPRPPCSTAPRRPRIWPWRNPPWNGGGRVTLARGESSWARTAAPGCSTRGPNWTGSWPAA